MALSGRLSKDIYASGGHHAIYEIIQNADDALPAPSTRGLSILVDNDSGIVIHNPSDAGFSVKDVQAICDLGRSSKEANPAKTGKFGIGFKSIFLVTNRPSILSSHASVTDASSWCQRNYGTAAKECIEAIDQWAFRFDSDDPSGLGMLIPRSWKNPLAEIRERMKPNFVPVINALMTSKKMEGTLFFAPSTPGLLPPSEFSILLHPHHLLFLRNLTSVTLWTETFSDHKSTIQEDGKMMENEEGNETLRPVEPSCLEITQSGKFHLGSKVLFKGSTRRLERRGWSLSRLPECRQSRRRRTGGQEAVEQARNWLVINFVARTCDGTKCVGNNASSLADFVTIAIPFNPENMEIIDMMASEEGVDDDLLSADVFSGLPLRHYGLPFIVNAPWKSTCARDGINTADPHSRSLVEDILPFCIAESVSIVSALIMTANLSTEAKISALSAAVRMGSLGRQPLPEPFHGLRSAVQSAFNNLTDGHALIPSCYWRRDTSGAPSPGPLSLGEARHLSVISSRLGRILSALSTTLKPEWILMTMAFRRMVPWSTIQDPWEQPSSDNRRLVAPWRWIFAPPGLQVCEPYDLKSCLRDLTLDRIEASESLTWLTFLLAILAEEFEPICGIKEALEAASTAKSRFNDLSEVADFRARIESIPIPKVLIPSLGGKSTNGLTWKDARESTGTNNPIFTVLCPCQSESQSSPSPANTGDALGSLPSEIRSSLQRSEVIRAIKSLHLVDFSHLSVDYRSDDKLRNDVNKRLNTAASVYLPVLLGIPTISIDQYLKECLIPTIESVPIVESMSSSSSESSSDESDDAFSDSEHPLSDSEEHPDCHSAAPNSATRPRHKLKKHLSLSQQTDSVKVGDFKGECLPMLPASANGSWRFARRTVVEQWHEKSVDEDEKAINVRTGLLGEAFAYHYLTILYRKEIDAGELAVTWVNEEGESGRHFDILIQQLKPGVVKGRLWDTHLDPEAIYIEVKASRSRVKSHFEVSFQEWNMAQEYGDKFQIFRVYNIGGDKDTGSTSAKDEPWIVRIRNPYAQWKRSRIGMMLSI